MKTIWCLLGYFFVGIELLFAQTNYYKETKTITRNGYEYQCDVKYNYWVRLYNKENQYTEDDVVYKATGETFDYPIEGGRNLWVIEPAPEMLRAAEDIVDEAFTREEAIGLKQHVLSTTMYIDPNSGKVIEVCFDFIILSGFEFIPVERYREIECKLKESLYFTPTETGKQLKVIMLSWSQTPTGYLGTPEPIEPPINP